MLSPLLFNIFLLIAAVLTVVLQRFSKDTAILAELVHLQGTTDVDGAGTGYGLRSSCGVRYVVCG